MSDTTTKTKAKTKTDTEDHSIDELSTRDGYPEGVTCWVDAELPDPVAARDFYGPLFGWEFTDRMPVDMEGHYFIASIDGLDVGAISSPGSDAPPAWNTYVTVASADDAVARAFQAGGRVVMPPLDFGDAGRMAIVTDPQGAAIRVWEPRKHHGAQVVNAFGAWNFSGLTTTDTGAASRFYNDVFGWETQAGEDGWNFLRMPGYGDHLEERYPGFHERMAAQDAPEGFADVTAWLSSLDGRPEGTPPNWSVTFSVEDTDASVERVKELGGAVIVDPFDAPPVRMAVVADPQGGVFAVSRYTPPNG